MPDATTPRTFEVAMEMEWAQARALMLRKQAAYGAKNIEVFGELGVLVRASDKLERLKHLARRKFTRPIQADADPDQADADPEWETVEDTWRDLMNYALIALMLRHGMWGLPMEAEGEEHPGGGTAKTGLRPLPPARPPETQLTIHGEYGHRDPATEERHD